MTRPLLIVVLIAFGALTTVAVWQHGVIGLFAWQLQNTAGMQVLADLVIALLLFCVWMWRDARASGRRPWPWLLLTLATGSFGPLLYLLTRRPGQR
ncbi:MAG: DUF2834 domain-containing protein [Rubrivivax sp.]|jgi:hypothetical protein|nr:DUF2834 domain-containing protein [Rubrivivax sp.]